MEIVKKWYIVNTQTGCENTAKSAIEERIRSQKLEEFFGEILIPAESVIELVKGETYRLHLSSIDLQHGFSLQPVNINLQVHPGYVMVVTMTPNQTGQFGIVCNEYCGFGHHTMTGRIYVVDNK